MIFERKKYLDELIAGRENGLVKIITGVRRCGKSGSLEKVCGYRSTIKILFCPFIKLNNG